MRQRHLYLGVATVILLVAIYQSWKQLNLAPLRDTEINLTLVNAIESLDPAKAFSDDSLLLSTQVLESLYQYHYLKRPYEIQPLLAENLPQVSLDGKVITLKIKSGVLYHTHESFKGNRELKAQDFVMAMKRLTMDSLQSPGKSLFSGLVTGFDEFGDAIKNDWKKLPELELPGIRALDDYTIEFRLLKREPNFTYYLSMNFLTPIPWEIVEFFQNDLGGQMIGTGPYLYKGFFEDYYELKRNYAYRQEFYPSSGDRYANVQKLLDSSKERIPFIDTVRFYLIKEHDRWQKFLDRDIDILTVPKAFIGNLYDEKGELRSDLKKQGIELKHFPILANRWFAFNMRDPVLGKKKELRKAIAYAIDYSKYIQLTSQNTNLRANSILAPGIAGYQPTKEFRYNYDLGKARELVKSVGEVPVIHYYTRGTEDIHLVEGKFIKDQLAKVGLRVDVHVLNFSEFLRRGRAGELSFFTDNWLFDYPDGENIIQLLVSSNAPGVNKSGYSNPKVDSLYGELREAQNQEQRERIFHEIEEVVLDDLPWIPMMYESSFVLQYPQIKNFRKSSLIRNYVKYLKIESN